MPLRAFATIEGEPIPETIICDACLGSAFARLDTHRRAKDDPGYVESAGRIDVDPSIPFSCVYCSGDGTDDADDE